MQAAVYGPLIGVAGAAAVAVAVELYRRRVRADSDLEVVRVDVTTDEERNRSPVLDVTVRNRGTAPAMIHELLVSEVEVWAFPAAVRPSARPVSWTYDIDLGSDNQVHRLSQEVRGGDGDRFEIRLGTSKAIFPFEGGYLYLFAAALVLDAARHTLDLGTFLVRVPQPMRVLGYRRVKRSEQEEQTAIANARRLAERVSNGVVIQDRARTILDEVLGGQKLPDQYKKRESDR
jgi:hypothetical protein